MTNILFTTVANCDKKDPLFFSELRTIFLLAKGTVGSDTVNYAMAGVRPRVLQWNLHDNVVTC